MLPLPLIHPFFSVVRSFDVSRMNIIILFIRPTLMSEGPDNELRMKRTAEIGESY